MAPAVSIEVEPSSADQDSFYDPWMDAKPHRRMYQNWDIKGRMAGNVTQVLGSRFTILQEKDLTREDDDYVSKLDELVAQGGGKEVLGVRSMDEDDPGDSRDMRVVNSMEERIVVEEVDVGVGMACCFKA
ncbi:hypothetical protein V6N13_033702 [Hibiscus sabdariffa]